MSNNPTVSVCMITYGHEKFIEQAINGVLMQVTDFEIELIIANDCSPDNTDIVIQNVLKNNPKASLIKYIKHEINIGMMPNFIFALNECKGKYIAICDGDDYWTDPYKLQKQVDFLEANEDYVLCFHKIKVHKVNGSIVDALSNNIKAIHQYETIEDLALKGNYIHTPSVVFRNIIKEFPKEFSLSPIGDYFLYMLLAQYGKLKYLDETMCVYREGVGVWSGKDLFYRSFNTAYTHALLTNVFEENEKIQLIFLQRINQFLNQFVTQLSVDQINKINVNNAVNNEILSFFINSINKLNKECIQKESFVFFIRKIPIKIKSRLINFIQKLK